MLRRERREPDDGDRDVEDDDQADGAEEAPRQIAPGRRVSSARFATVSSPVYASIASGIANASECQVGDVPREVPALSAPGEKRSAIPSTTIRSWVDEVERGDDQGPAVQAGAVDEPDHATPAITPQPATTSHGRWILVKNAPAT